MQECQQTTNLCAPPKKKKGRGPIRLCIYASLHFFLSIPTINLPHLMIKDPLPSSSWRSVLNKSNSFFVNSSKYLLVPVTALNDALEADWVIWLVDCWSATNPSPADDDTISARTSKSRKTTWLSKKKRVKHKNVPILDMFGLRNLPVKYETTRMYMANKGNVYQSLFYSA